MPNGGSSDGRDDAIWARLREELSRLLRPGMLARYDHIELNEIIATPKRARPLNVLSIAVLGEGRRDVKDAEQTQMLTGRITVEGFKDWSFGIARTVRPLDALDKSLATFAATGVWALSGRPLRTGALRPEPTLFVPPDGTDRVPVNSVLKNNFWAGSHVVRLADREKHDLAPFLSDRRRLQTLSDSVSGHLPIAFAGLADLLGDVLIQLPVTLMNFSVQGRKPPGPEEVAISWRPDATPRPLRIAARTRWDGALTGAAIAEASAAADGSVPIPIDAGHQPLETEIWDSASGFLIGATAATSTIARLGVHMRLVQPEPRLFTAPDADGVPRAGRVQLHSLHDTIVGEPEERDRQHWLLHRQELEERRRLDETRDFVQYRPKVGLTFERARALDDLRRLVEQHGEAGVDLWDPYLTATDILQTLFWSQRANAPLRALTDGRDPPRKADEVEPAQPLLSFADRQRDAFTQFSGNREGLQLEYRTRSGPGGWPFHDRFLIFPNGREGPMAWSLGTSVNSAGKAHHILQRVSNSALIAGAFEDLWTTLDQPRNLIWRSW